MYNSYETEEDLDLIENSSARIPVCLCLDISNSMNKNGAINGLNSGVGMFLDAVNNNSKTKDMCEVAIVTFNGEVEVVQDFQLVGNSAHPSFTAIGGTAMAHAVEKALDMLENRKQQYKNNGVGYFQPWLVLITDGMPGDVNEIPSAQSRTKALIQDKKLVLFPVVVGTDSDESKTVAVMNTLNGFSPVPKAKMIRDLKFEEFFEWLTNSVAVVSDSLPGDKILLPSTSDWGEI